MLAASLGSEQREGEMVFGSSAWVVMNRSTEVDEEDAT
jgi:hypothetical protein